MFFFLLVSVQSSVLSNTQPFGNALITSVKLLKKSLSDVCISFGHHFKRDLLGNEMLTPLKGCGY